MPIRSVPGSGPRQDLALGILVVDPDPASADALCKAFKNFPVVLFARRAATLHDAAQVIAAREINAIYIDPIGLGIEPAGDFIFGLRKSHPGIVFVLYLDSDKLKSVENTFFGGERDRFRHYFRLDKRTPRGQFIQSVEDTVRACQDDLAYVLTQDTIQSLRHDLASIQSNASEQTASVPLTILKQIQEQLKARQQETSAGSIHRGAHFLGPIAASVKAERCFVIMPYSESWSKAVEAVIKESCRAAGVEFAIAKTMEARFVPHDIWQGITGSGILIADLTGANANVTYEVGLADALGREVVLICQGTKVPFDFLGQRLIEYEDTVAGALDLGTKLTERLTNLKLRSISEPARQSPGEP